MQILRAHEAEGVGHAENVVGADAEQDEKREKVEHWHFGNAHHASVDPEGEEECRKDPREREERNSECINEEALRVRVNCQRDADKTDT